MPKNVEELNNDNNNTNVVDDNSNNNDNSKTVTNVTPEPALSPREAAMREIIERRNQMVAEEAIYGAEVNDDGSLNDGSNPPSDSVVTPVTNDPVVVDNSKPNKTEADKSATATTTTTPDNKTNNDALDPSDPNKVVTVYIGGKPYNVTNAELSQLVTTNVQKHYSPAPQQQAPVAAPQPVQQPVQQINNAGGYITEDEARDIYGQFVNGTDDDGAKALQKMSEMIASRVRAEQQQSQAPVDIGSIEESLMGRIHAKQTLENNLRIVGEEFPNVFADGRVAKLASEEANKVAEHYRAIGINKGQLDIFREACSNINGLMGYDRDNSIPENNSVQAAQPLTQPSVVSKAGSKRTLVTVPSGTGARANETTSVQPPRSRHDVVKQMKIARGQLVVD